MKVIDGYYAFFKEFCDSNKTNQDNIEKQDNFGIIPNFKVPGCDLNPCTYFGSYLKTLNPENPRLFQREIRPSKKFKIHDLKRTCLFENCARGEHKTEHMLRLLCEAVDKPGLGNHSLRATGIQLLKENKFEDRIIMKFSSKYTTYQYFALLWLCQKKA